MKTGSTTLLRAIKAPALAEGRQQKVSRVYVPYDRVWDEKDQYAMHALKKLYR